MVGITRVGVGHVQRVAGQKPAHAHAHGGADGGERLGLDGRQRPMFVVIPVGALDGHALIARRPILMLLDLYGEAERIFGREGVEGIKK